MPHPEFNNTMYNIPHIDDTKYTNEIWNIIYYPEDYDGDTIIFNEKFDGKKPKELTIRERIKPQENKKKSIETEAVEVVEDSYDDMDF